MPLSKPKLAQCPRDILEALNQRLRHGDHKYQRQMREHQHVGRFALAGPRGPKAIVLGAGTSHRGNQDAEREDNSQPRLARESNSPQGIRS
jgi:hypothetical protein